MVVLEHEGKQVCVLIDKLLQEQEIVVKANPIVCKEGKGNIRVYTIREMEVLL